MKSEVACFLGDQFDFVKLYALHDGTANMWKTSENLKINRRPTLPQHGTAHPLHLLITDGINKIPDLKYLLENSVSVVNTLHFMGHLLEQPEIEVKDRVAADKLFSIKSNQSDELNMNESSQTEDHPNKDLKSTYNKYETNTKELKERNQEEE